LRDLLRACLNDTRYDRFRFIVAFARWSGLFLVDTELQNFSQRKSTSIEGYVGVDLGGTTVEALTYLSELTSATINVVESNMRGVVFHPKVFEFSGKNDWLTIVGSSNMTMGGFLSNVEASVVIQGKLGDVCPSSTMFDQLAPAAPFTSDHVRPVDGRLLAEIAPRLDHYTKRSPDWGGGGASTGLPLRPDLILPNPGRPPSPAAYSSKGKQRKTGATTPSPRGPVRTTATAAATRDVLFVELWDETRDGTQVQLPRRMFTEYFGADPTAVTWIIVRPTNGGMERIRLQGFSNSTFRISLPFVGHSAPGAGRRAVLRFERLAQDDYSCSMLRRGQADYAQWLKACTEQTSRTSKRFGVAPSSSAPGRRRPRRSR
jgi:hypothetical protein